MADRWHVEWLKEGVTRWNARRKRVKFRPDLSSISFFEILPPDFRDDPKTSRYFEKIDLSDADLHAADLSRLNFSKANFSGTNLAESDLSRSNFSEAQFRFSDLRNASFDGSILSGAEFENPQLDDTSFQDVEADEVVFIAASFAASQREHLSQAQLREYTSRAMYLESTRRTSTRITDFLGNSLATEKGSLREERTKKNAYEVFYGTTRNPIFERGAITGYGAEQWDQTNYGVAEVIVPDGHRIGGIGKKLFRNLFNKSSCDLRITKIISLNEALFFSVLKEVNEKGGQQQRPTIFIHGYNTTFEGAVLRAGQFGHDLGISQGIGLFSWPSKGTEFGYPSDEGSAERNKYALSGFIESFVSAFGDKGISVVAHSMGCRCLLGAVEHLSAHNASAASSIHQVILAAADVDSAMMPWLGSKLVANADRSTSYVGDKDKALRLSRWFHSFDRVGLVPPVIAMPGLDNVLVNNSDLGLFSHGYIGSSRAVLADIHALLTKNEPPENRFSVRSHSISNVPIWKLAD